MPPVTTTVFCQTILDNFQLVSGANHLVPVNRAAEYDNYYVVSEVSEATLLQDVVKYYLKRRRQAKSRRLCFLIDNQAHVGALFLDFSQIDFWAIEILENQLAKAAPIEVADMVNKPEFKVLYKNVNCVYFSTSNRPEELQRLIPHIRKVYERSAITITFRPMPDTTMQKLLFTGIVMQFLQEGNVNRIDVRAIQQRYQNRCLQLVDQYLQRLRRDDLLLFDRVTRQLQILFKYQLLHAHRERLPANENTIEQLELNWQRYLYLKKMIYSEATPDVLTLCQRYSLTNLVSFLAAVKTQSVLNHLTVKRRERLDAMQVWEQAFQQRITTAKQSWGAYLTWLGKKACTTVYQATLVDLTRILSKWVVTCLAEIDAMSEKAMRAKRYVLAGIERGVRVVSPQSAMRISRLLDSGLSQRALMYLAQFVGVGAGVFVTWWMGGYSFVRLLGIHVVGAQAQRYLNRRQFNDMAASCATFLVNSTYIISGISVSVAGLETLYTGNSKYIVYALGGTVGSMAATNTAAYLVPELRSGQSWTEERVLLLFFVAMMGQQTGRLLTVVGHQFYDNFNTCLIAAKRLDELSQAEADVMAESVRPLAWQAECRRGWGSWRFWFSQKQPLRFSFTTANKTFVDMQCQGAKTSQFYGVIDCDETEESPVLRLQPV